MTPDARFSLNESHAVHETFDGEVLAINLDTGTYYSLPGLSAAVWSWLIGGSPLAEIAAELAGEGETDPVARELQGFADKLVANSLIVPRDPGMPTEGSGVARPDLRRPAFSPLVVDIFTDMQDLLLLDPIHDVAEAGWPLAKAEGPPAN